MEEFDLLVKQYHDKKKSYADPEEMAKLLEQISKVSYDEQLLFELALWHWKAGYPARAKRTCRQMITFFRDGIWTERARQVQELLQADADFPEHMEKYLVSASDTEETQPDIPPVIQEAFAGIVGMEAVKKELTRFYNVAKLELLREKELGIQHQESRSYHFVLYGNPGTGKTTVARIIAKVLYALGIRKTDKFMETDRSKLVSQYIGQTSINVRDALASIKGGTLFIDEAYSLYKPGDEKDFGREAIDTLLKDMEDHRTDYTVILAGYRAQMTDMLNHANPGFRSRFTYHITIPDYTDEELLKIAEETAKRKSYRLEERAYDAIRKRISRERIDETFGNARFIRELINEAETNLASRLNTAGKIRRDELRTLCAEDFDTSSVSSENLSLLLDQLNSMVGLRDVKTAVQELLDAIEVQKAMEKFGFGVQHDLGTLHMAFKGNAGTGKTTVARLLGKILCQMDVLKRGDVFVEVHARELIGQYQGHTANKVREIIRSAMGGVLFIDEAYSMVTGAGDSFGQEAVSALVAEMENHRDSLMVIFAGYTRDIDRFLAENQGLRSRVTRDLFFEDYTVEEMVQIFRLIAESQQLILSRELDPAISALLSRKQSQTPDFGNGRGVRNVLEAVCRAKDRRVATLLRSGKLHSKQELVTITQEDIENVK